MHTTANKGLWFDPQIFPYFLFVTFDFRSGVHLVNHRRTWILPQLFRKFHPLNYLTTWSGYFYTHYNTNSRDRWLTLDTNMQHQEDFNPSSTASFINFIPDGGHTDIGISVKVTVIGLLCYLAVFFSLALGIAFDNIMVMFAFFEDSRIRRKPANYFLVSLAFADLLTGLVAIPLNVANRLIVSRFTCYSSTRYILFLPLLLFCGVSMLHLVFIAIDR